MLCAGGDRGRCGKIEDEARAAAGAAAQLVLAHAKDSYVWNALKEAFLKATLMSTLSGQTFTTLQILGAFASLEISWDYPFRYLVIHFGGLGLGMDFLRVDCVSAPRLL